MAIIVGSDPNKFRRAARGRVGLSRLLGQFEQFQRASQPPLDLRHPFGYWYPHTPLREDLRVTLSIQS